MSRIAKAPISLPAGVEATVTGQEVKVKGGKGELSLTLHQSIRAEVKDNIISVSPVAESKDNWAMAGTMRSLANNMVIGVSQGFEKKLELKGVGYRAQVKGKVINLTLGFSHPVEFAIPEGITAETPSQTEIILKGVDKQLIGQAAANIRAYRPPEPYKGKGVRYADEHVRRKEAKKK
ncbi:50S ribosomal protein L6 [Gammaproteobacteria bacterium 42_54_T18]|nr:50S ribosomal protein L6 [Gammaproteobacteria bacterium 42_54_T18]